MRKFLNLVFEKIFYYKHENYLKKCLYTLYIKTQSFDFNNVINPITKRHVRVGGATFKKSTYVLNPNNGNKIKISGPTYKKIMLAQ